jgi:hypothetical protein
MAEHDDDLFADLEPGEYTGLRVGALMFQVTATNEYGMHTGRRRYAVRCLACGIEVHAETTGPEEQAKAHASTCFEAAT